MTFSLSTIENTIRSKVVEATGLGDENVIWENQNGDRPTTPYISLKGEIIPLGHDAKVVENAAIPSAGAEITYHLIGMRELQIFFQAFGGSHRGDSSAHGLLNTVYSKFQLPSYLQAFKTAGWGMARRSRITSIGAGLGSIIEPRSMFDVTGFVASHVTEDGTYIETVGITNTGLTGNFTVDSTA